MPLPEIPKSWEFDVNQIYTAEAAATPTYQKIVHGIKHSLVGVLGNRPNMDSPWVVKRSSDGALAQNGDLWTEPGKLVWGTPNRSWIVLEQAGITSSFQICIDLVGGNSNVMTVVWAPAGFPPDGGSVDARPQASPEVVLLSNVIWLGDQWSPQIAIHAMQSTDGQCTRVIGYWNGVPVLFWLFDRPSRPVAGWTLPAVALATGSFDANLRYADLHKVAAPNLHGYNTADMLLWMSTESFGTGAQDSVAAVGDGVTGASSFDGNWPLTPIGIASRTGGHLGRHGELFDLWFGPTGAAHGDTYPADATRILAQFGHLVFPWEGVNGPGASVPAVS